MSDNATSDNSKGILGLLAIIVLLAVLMGGKGAPSATHKGQSPAAPAAPTGGYAITGQPSISGQFIDTILCTWHSPACHSGQELHDLGAQYGIDPAYALAFFMNESTFGTAGMARITQGLGNERCIQDRPCVNYQGGDCQNGQSCYAKFSSWSDGFEHWYSLILYGYVKGQINQAIGRQACPCVTIDQIIPVYAPNRDNNNEQHYIYVVEHAVSLWRAGKVALV